MRAEQLSARAVPIIAAHPVRLLRDAIPARLRLLHGPLLMGVRVDIVAKFAIRQVADE